MKRYIDMRNPTNPLSKDLSGSSLYYCLDSSALYSPESSPNDLIFPCGFWVCLRIFHSFSLRFFDWLITLGSFGMRNCTTCLACSYVNYFILFEIKKGPLNSSGTVSLDTNFVRIDIF
jgi:hypothetical protein